MRRLQNVLAAVALACIAAADQTPTNWSDNLRVNPMNDQSEGSVSLTDAAGDILSYACNGEDEKTLSVQFLPKRYLGGREGPVTLRFDSDPAFPTTVWAHVYRGAYSTSSALVDAFARAVGSGTRLIRVQALNYEQQPVYGSFSSTNGLVAVNRVRAACGRPAF